MTMMRIAMLRRTLLSAAAISAAATAGVAQAQDAGASSSSGAIVVPRIVIRDDLNNNEPPPAGSLDSGITGIGHVVTDQQNGFIGLCTGSLINPRTVIFAAHCVNDRPASAYGEASGGLPMTVNFNPDSLPGLIDWFNGTDTVAPYASNPDSYYYNVNQVWYDPRSLAASSCVAPGACFLEADIAIATLDTPATNIPTWAMLFTPLDGPTHGSIVGYGNSGNASNPELEFDFRRRAAENMISVLGSLDDVDNWLFAGGPFTANPQNLYMTSFNNPDGDVFDPANGQYDFGVFGGEALPFEATTAQGDSGGPLIVDQRYSMPIIAAVLSGGSRFFGAQSPESYGTTSFYQPLFLYWETIVANNSYVYASNRAGSRNWDDPRHWVQLMDPNYMIDVNGRLVNGLPTFREDGNDGNGPKFGSVCIFDDCNDLSDEGSALPASTGPILVPGGPGSTNFVPNNVDPDPTTGRRARYFDVTLAAAGTTTLRTQVEIDAFSLANPLARLDIRSQGNLSVLGDYNQLTGWTNVDGTLATDDMLVLTGILSGRGRIDPSFLTLGVALVAPGGSGIGTLTVQGDVIFTSATTLNIELGRSTNDRLAVTGDADNSGVASLDGTLLLTPNLASLPRHNTTYTIITAEGDVDGRFDLVANLLGLLRPELQYGENDVRVRLKAGSIFDFIRGLGATAEAIGRALDALRDGSYANLTNLYGAVDLMEPQMLANTLNNLAPDIAGENRMLEERQSRVMLNAVTDRLSMLGTMPGGTMSFSSDSGVMSVMAGNATPRTLGFNSVVPARSAMRGLPQHMTGFASSGYSMAGSTIGSDRTGTFGGQQSWHISMGLEMQVAPDVTMGTAFGYSDGISRPGASSRTDTRMSQVAVYGTYQLGGGAYVAGVASADLSRFNLSRDVVAGPQMNLTGASSSSRLSARMEAGVNFAMSGLTLTPRVALGYSSYGLDGFREQGGEAALAFDEVDIQQLETRIGAQLTGQRRLSGGWRFAPQLAADFVSLLSGADNGMNVRFAAAPDASFLLPLAGGDSAWGEVRGGFRLVNGPLSFGAGLETTVGRSSFRDDRAVADVSFRF